MTQEIAVGNFVHVTNIIGQEFCGTVQEYTPEGIVLEGVMLNAIHGTTSLITLNNPPNRPYPIKVLAPDEFAKLVKLEPAFVGMMSKEMFLEVQADIEALELSIAKGEEADDVDERLNFLYYLQSQATWIMDPDEGCVKRPELPAAEDEQFAVKA